MTKFDTNNTNNENYEFGAKNFSAKDIGERCFGDIRYNIPCSPPETLLTRILRGCRSDHPALILLAGWAGLLVGLLVAMQ